MKTKERMPGLSSKMNCLEMEMESSKRRLEWNTI
jgi:hypothetical protein